MTTGQVELLEPADNDRIQFQPLHHTSRPRVCKTSAGERPLVCVTLTPDSWWSRLSLGAVCHNEKNQSKSPNYRLQIQHF